MRGDSDAIVVSPWPAQNVYRFFRRNGIYISVQNNMEALSICEKELPPSALKPHVHPMVHYPRCVSIFGPLPYCWIQGDERRNKVIKGMSKHRGRCEVSIARVYSEYVVGRDSIVGPQPVSLDTGVRGKVKPYVVRDATAKQALLRIIETDV